MERRSTEKKVDASISIYVQSPLLGRGRCPPIPFVLTDKEETREPFIDVVDCNDSRFVSLDMPVHTLADAVNNNLPGINTAHAADLPSPLEIPFVPHNALKIL